MSPVGRSLGAKLALLFAVITAIAFSAVFFAVVPQLQSSLEHQRLNELQRVAPAFTPLIEGAINKEIKAPKLDELVRSLADSSDAEVTVSEIQRQTGADPKFGVYSNSRVSAKVDASVALEVWAYKTHHTQGRIIDSASGRTAQVAVPVPPRRPVWMAVYARDLSDVHGTVHLIRTRVLIAGGIALVIALLGGYFVARRLARRVKSLESAAKSVAEGNFHEPLAVTSEDELGQLTRTFNEMQAQLAQMDTARREFIANASHELRTPIFSIGGFVELLQDEDLDEETRSEFLWLMREQIERLQKLDVSLLDLSLIDAGSLELNPEEVDLSELAREVAGEFTPALTSHRARLELNFPDGQVDAVCDRERVAQIMRILLDNALRHTPEGTQVTVTADRDNGAAEITVADAGPGLSAEAVPHVFDRFYTADATR